MKYVRCGHRLARVAVACFVALVVASHSAYAQEDAPFEIALGMGYLHGVGADVSRVATPAFNGGVAFWPHPSFGVAATVVYGPGGDRFDVTEPLASEGEGSVRLLAVTLRYRRPLGHSMHLNLGVGAGYGSHETAGGRPALAGYSLELLVGRRLSATFGVKGGLCIDAIGADGMIIRPSINATVSF